MDNKKAAEILRAIKIGTAYAFLNDDAITSALDIAIATLEKQEQDSNKCCETCKYKNLPVSENPCDECYFASDYEDYYEAEEDNE